MSHISPSASSCGTETRYRGAVVSCGPLFDPRDELADIKAMKTAVEEKDAARSKELENLWSQIEGALMRCDWLGSRLTLK